MLFRSLLLLVDIVKLGALFSQNVEHRHMSWGEGGAGVLGKQGGCSPQLRKLCDFFGQNANDLGDT